MRVPVCRGVGFFEPPQVISLGAVLGFPVRNQRGENLGRLDEVVFDADEARIAYAILVFENFSEEVPEKRFAIPWKALVLRAEEGFFMLKCDRNTLEDAPGFDRTTWSRMTERQWLSELYHYYGYVPYWK